MECTRRYYEAEKQFSSDTASKFYMYKAEF